MFDKKLVTEYFLKTKENIEKLKITERELKVEILKDKAITIIGPRRAGKTYFLKHIAREIREFFYIDFENVIFRKLAPEEFFKVLSVFLEIFGKEPKVLFLDEIQILDRWEGIVRSLLDLGYSVFISGSSSKLMSKEIATQLRGRTLTYVLLPFSFKEFLVVNKIEIKSLFSISEEAKMKKTLKEYLFSSTYPEILLTGNTKLLKEYYNTILYTDFVERFQLKSLEVARFIFDFCLLNFSKEFSVIKVSNFLKTMGIKCGKNTVYNYIEKLPETLNVFFLRKYEKSIYRTLWPRKIYICDLGMADIISLSKDIGRRMENTVFLELLRKTNQEPLLEIFYFKTREGYEVDFLVKEGLRIKQLIQVSYANSYDEIDHREIRALLHAKEVFKKDKPKLLVITWDYEDEKQVSWFGKRGEIRFIPLWKWLLTNSQK